MILAFRLPRIMASSLIAVLTIVNPITMGGTTLAASPETANTVISNPNVQQDFCSRLTTLDIYLDNLITQRISLVNTARNDRSNKLTSQFAALDVERSANRTKWDSDRDTQYEKMYEKATTNIQKQAIDQFKATIEDAVTKRRADVDSAASTYRNSIKTSMTLKQSGVDGAIDTYKSTVLTAETNAQASCSAGVGPGIVREVFLTELQTARTSLKTGENGTNNLDNKITTHSVSYQKTVEIASAEFNATLIQARDTLKLALKQ